MVFPVLADFVVYLGIRHHMKPLSIAPQKPIARRHRSMNRIPLSCSTSKPLRRRVLRSDVIEVALVLAPLLGLLPLMLALLPDLIV